MEKVVLQYSENAINYLDELIFILYTQEYFGFIENAERYIDNIYDAIEIAIQRKQYKSTPIALIKHGSFYIAFKANKHTTWYAFFNIKENKYLIRHITNNHQKEASFLNK